MAGKTFLACGLGLLTLCGDVVNGAGRDVYQKSYKRLVYSLPQDTPKPSGEMDMKSYYAARQVAKHVEKLWAGYVEDDCSEVPSTIRMNFGGQSNVVGAPGHIDSGKYKRVIRGLEFMENDEVEWPNKKVAPVTKQTHFLDKLASPIERKCLRNGKNDLRNGYCIMNPDKLAFELLVDEIGELPVANNDILNDVCGTSLMRRDADLSTMNITAHARSARAAAATATASKWKAPGTCNTTTYFGGMATYYTCGQNTTCGCLRNVSAWSNECGLGLIPDALVAACDGLSNSSQPNLGPLQASMTALGSQCTATQYLWRLQYVFTSCASTYTNQSLCDCQAAVSSAQACTVPPEWTLATPNYTVVAPNNVCDLPTWASKTCTKEIYLSLAATVFEQCSNYWVTATNATASAPANDPCCTSRTAVQSQCGISWDQYTMHPFCATTKTPTKKAPAHAPLQPAPTPTYSQCSMINGGGGSGMGYSVYCVGLDGSKRYVWEGGMGGGGGFTLFDTSMGQFQYSYGGGGGGGSSVYTDACTQDQYNAGLCAENGYMGMGMGGGSAAQKRPNQGSDLNTDTNFRQFNRAFHQALQIVNDRRKCPIILISGGGGGGGGYSAANQAGADSFSWNTGYGFGFEVVLCPACRPKNSACPTPLPHPY